MRQRKRNSSDDYFVSAIGEALRECLNSGFALPLHAAVVSANGSALVMRYVSAEKGALEPVTLSEHYESNAFIFPINIMITDGHGESARVVIGQDGRPRMIH